MFISTVRFTHSRNVSKFLYSNKKRALKSISPRLFTPSFVMKKYYSKPPNNQDKELTVGDFLRDVPEIVQLFASATKGGKDLNENSELADLVNSPEFEAMASKEGHVDEPLPPEMKEQYLKLIKLRDLMKSDIEVYKSTDETELSTIEFVNQKIIDLIVNEEYILAEILFLDCINNRKVGNGDFKAPSPNLKTYLLMLDLYRKQYKLRRAEVLLLSMEYNGIEPSTQCYNILLDFYLSVDLYDQALDQYEKMLEKKVEPNEKTHEHLIGIYCGLNEFDLALDEYKKFRKKYPDSPSTIMYGRLMEMYDDSGKKQDANKIMKQFLKRGFDDPDFFTEMMISELGGALKMIKPPE